MSKLRVQLVGSTLTEFQVNHKTWNMTASRVAGTGITLSCKLIGKSDKLC